MRTRLALLAIAFLSLALPAQAHHTFVTKYDPAKLITVSGVVTSVSFTNPHISFEVQSAGASWTVETESISAAQGKGLTQKMLKEGAKVTVTGWRARNGSAAMGLSSITISGGPSVTMRRTAR
jgi:hypothetical protein